MNKSEECARKLADDCIEILEQYINSHDNLHLVVKKEFGTDKIKIEIWESEKEEK